MYPQIGLRWGSNFFRLPRSQTSPTLPELWGILVHTVTIVSVHYRYTESVNNMSGACILDTAPRPALALCSPGLIQQTCVPVGRSGISQAYSLSCSETLSPTNLYWPFATKPPWPGQLINYLGQAALKPPGLPSPQHSVSQHTVKSWTCISAKSVSEDAH